MEEGEEPKANAEEFNPQSEEPTVAVEEVPPTEEYKKPPAEPPKETATEPSKTALKQRSSAAVLRKSQEKIGKSQSRVRMEPLATSTPQRERTSSSAAGLPRRASSRLSKEERTSRELLERRRSSARSRSRAAFGSTISIRKESVYGDSYEKGGKAPRFMNTYKLESDNPFNPEKVEKILEAVMLEALENLTYDPDKVPKQAKWASGVIRSKVKELEFDRYKLICLVSIGEKQSQDVYATCKFLWDAERDRHAIFVHENMYLFGIAMCFGLYYE